MKKSAWQTKYGYKICAGPCHGDIAVEYLNDEGVCKWCEHGWTGEPDEG